MAGADGSTALSFAMGTSQPATETFVAALHGSPYDTGLSLEKLIPIAEYLKKVREKYSHLFTGIRRDVNVPAQIPGGMYSNQSQLMSKRLNKLDIVLKEVERVRREMGHPPLVTPTSQLGDTGHPECLGGERWKVVPEV